MGLLEQAWPERGSEPSQGMKTLGVSMTAWTGELSSKTKRGH